MINLKYQVRSHLSLHPKLFFPLVNLKKNSCQLAINNETDIVIEGFPRSGNSFAVGAFRSAQSKPVNIATHLHAPAQIIVATRKNIPTLVVIRNPVDAVISLKALHIECNAKAVDTATSSYNFEILLKSYIDFYKTIAPYRNKYILCCFEEVVRDFSKTISKINQHFNTKFDNFEHTETNVQKVLEQQGFHAGPTVKRQQLKKLLYKEIERVKYQHLVSEAKQVYQKFQILNKES